MSHPPSEKKHTGLIVGITVAVITFVIFPLTVVFFSVPVGRLWDQFFGGTAVSGPTESGVTSEPAESGVTSEPVVSEGSDGPTSLTAPSPVPGGSPSLSEFEIILYEPGYGREVSDGVYKMTDAYDPHRLNIVYGWKGYMSNGILNTSENCEILASVTGPQRIPSYETNKCSYGGSTNVITTDTDLQIEEPGIYTITVEDGKSGASGSLTFEVR